MGLRVYVKLNGTEWKAESGKWWRFSQGLRAMEASNTSYTVAFTGLWNLFFIFIVYDKESKLFSCECT